MLKCHRINEFTLCAMAWHYENFCYKDRTIGYLETDYYNFNTLILLNL